MIIQPEESFVPPKAGNSWYLIMSLQFPSLPFGLISESRSVVGKTVHGLLADLLEVGLLEPSVHRDIERLLEEFGSIAESKALRQAADAMLLLEQRPQLYQQENTWLKSLYRAEALSKDGLRRALQRSESSSPLSPLAAFEYADRSTVLDLDKLPTELTECYTVALNTIGALIPDFNITDLRVDTVPGESFADWQTKDLLLTMTVDGQEYAQRGFYDGTVSGQWDETDALLTDDFHQIFNQVLADRESRYRLFSAVSSRMNTKKRGYVLLDKKQHRAWNTLDYVQLAESFSSTLVLTADERSRILATYEHIGLLDRLTPEEVATGESCVQQNKVAHPIDILRCLPRTLVVIDWETGNLENPYGGLIREFAAASWGAFQPTDIQDSFAPDWEAATTTFGFRLGSVSYEAALTMDRDWLDPAFLDLIFRAMTESGIPGKFHYVFDDGQVSGYLYFEPTQYEALLTRQPELFLSD